ncbi:hypothetical protein [Pseudomarimonas salicorniae]|uniref:Matrixin n=1 Tax=Pseudomarimonas salicorniae TaxID=2933270 RepID=A0ABT0GJA4_9GAMM|nr:hypothetical protein [Lysobacter sp. CAU 1642]MCK7594493.1 hypothetical protein [Lysobacter sp. CAU 1642]
MVRMWSAVWLLAVALALALAWFSGPAAALSYVMMADEDLFDEAEGVARVTVVSRLPLAGGDRETRYLLTVNQVLSGPKTAATEILALPGTRLEEGGGYYVPGVPGLREGTTLLLFYSRAEDGSLRAQQLSMGLFGREQTAKGQFYVRYLEMSSDLSKDAVLRRYHAPRDPEAFERWIADRARGARRAPDYLRGELQALQSSKFNFTVFDFGGSGSGPARWFQFDSGQSLAWTAGSGGQANTSFDEFASLQQALAAWQNDAGSRIQMHYVGAQASAPSCVAGGQNNCLAGHVYWNDPNNQISGSFNCSGGGVLAIGGSFAYTPATSFNGQSWFRRSAADVIVQDNAGCFLDGNSGANGANLLAHEVGHAIGFDHSCGDADSGSCSGRPEQNEATMRSQAHNDGRGAVLGSDDRAGALVIYPAPPATPVGPTLSPVSPLNNSTTALAGGSSGTTVSANISFQASGGAAAGTTQLVCSGSGGVSIGSGSPQTVAVGGTVAPVVARMVLGGSAQSGSVACTMTPQNGTPVNYSFNFTAPAASAACTGTCLLRTGFE